MHHPPALILLQYFKDLGYLTSQEDELDWPGYHSHLPDVTKEQQPKNVAALYDTSGVLDGRLMETGEVIRHPGVQVRVRSGSYLVGYRKIEELRLAMAAIRRTTVTLTDENNDDYSYRIDNVTMSGDVAVMGQRDKTRREEFTQNVLLTVTEI